MKKEVEISTQEKNQDSSSVHGIVPFPRKPHQSLAGKDVRQVPNHLKKPILQDDEDSILNINCMNCQVLIPLDKIEEHSKFCTSLTEDVKNIELDTFLAQILFKLRKLETCLLDKNNSSELRPGDRNYISILLRLCQKLVNDQSGEQNDLVLKSLSSLLVTFKGTIGIRIYADRLQSLAHEQKMAFQQMEIEEAEKTLETLRNEKVCSERKIIGSGKLQIRIPTDSEVNRRVDEVSSDIGSLMSIRSYLSKSSVVDDETGNIDEEYFLSSSDDLQKQFYTLCLSLKLKFVEDNKLQNISILRLYQEAVIEEVPKEKWVDFIISKLKLLAAQEKTSKTKRRIQPRSSASRPQYFEAIIEEEKV